MPGEFSGGLHPALLPVLLALSQNGKDIEKTLDDLVGFIQSTKNAMQAMRSGLETFHSGIIKMALTPAGGPARPVPPLTWPSPPPKPVTPIPVKEPEAVPEKEPDMEPEKTG